MCSLLVVEGAFKKDVLDDFQNEINACANWDSHHAINQKTKFWAHCYCKYKYGKKNKIDHTKLKPIHTI